ncbi:MAG: hypothetical protein ACRDZU_16555 [Acidimicrobiales bacterium]
MVDPPTYRAEPDPAFAARLERLLLQRLTAGSDEPRSVRRGVASDGPIDTHPNSDDDYGDLIMLETETRPPHQPPPSSGRGSRARWLMAAAAAAVIALVGTLVVAAGDDDEEPVDTVTSTPTTVAAPARDVMEVPGISNGFPDLEPGRWFIDPDGDETTPLRVSYQVAAEGWSAWFGAVKSTGPGFTMLSITTVTNLVSDGCSDWTPLEPPVGPTVDDLATALSQLAPFDVTAPATDVTLFGYPGKHLQLTVPDGGFADCLDGELHSWISPLNDNGATSFSGYDTPGQTEEFWILDVEGTRLVLVKIDSPQTPAEDTAERDAIFDSIRIEHDSRNP